MGVKRKKKTKKNLYMNVSYTSSLFLWIILCWMANILLRIWATGHNPWSATFLPGRCLSLPKSRLRPSSVSWRAGHTRGGDSWYWTSPTRYSCFNPRLENMEIPSDGIYYMWKGNQYACQCYIKLNITEQNKAYLQRSPYQHPPFWKYLHIWAETGLSCR